MDTCPSIAERARAQRRRSALRSREVASGPRFFHLGVIRRLEELRIMSHVDVISAVSGGSIIAAYYICEMEKWLRRISLSKEQNWKQE